MDFPQFICECTAPLAWSRQPGTRGGINTKPFHLTTMYTRTLICGPGLEDLANIPHADPAIWGVPNLTSRVISPCYKYLTGRILASEV